MRKLLPGGPFLTLLLIMQLCLATAGTGQYLPPRLAIHLSNPLSYASKFGVKLQYRLNIRHSVLVGYRSYYNFFPGYQGSIEYHGYYRSWERSEAFFYGKFGVGNSSYSPKSYYTGWDAKYAAPAGYGFLGAGLGKRWNFGHFFIEGNVGLKYTELLEPAEPENPINRNLFYTTGPGSLVDCGVTFGLQFFDEARHMYYHTLAPRRRARFSN